MKRTILSLLFAAATATTFAETTEEVQLIESVQISTAKQGSNIQMEPLASTTLHQSTIEQNQIEAIKDLQTLVPNLFIPNYGSRITSSIYIRGLGARIDNPALGLNIDNVPYLNKNGFDSDAADIARMEVLRGPQSTLYGRNTMGGVINIYTLSPMDFQGVKVGLEYSSGNTYSANASAYHKFNDKFALSAGIQYNSTDGFFENLYTGENADTERGGSARLKLQYAPSSSTMIENTLSASLLTQGGYPYMALNGEYAGEVNYNDPSSYDRMMINNGLSIRHDFGKTTLTSVTGYQHLDDSMTLDQDFSPESYFTLTQATKEHSASQDIVWKSKKSTGYNFLVGAFGFYKNQDIAAPVMFKEAGIENLILANVNAALPSFPPMELVWDEDEFLLGSDFTYSTYGAALYHESKYTLGKFDFAVGIRADFEEARLKYHNYVSTSASMYIFGISSGSTELDIDNKDDLKNSFFEILPKATINYSINNNNSIYVTAAKGYKAGGFNTQMFSDILREQLMNEARGLESDSSVEDVITYAPEYSWNYEIGGHFANKNRTLRADIALFYIDIRDQQLTVFPTPESTGRMTTNAGRSRSYGAEISASARLGNFTLNGAYGYTNAKFIDYTDYTTDEDDNTIELDYSGNFVPYAPQQTLSAAAIYTLNIGKNWLNNIDFEINTTAAGKIYWDEANTVEQPFYALLGAAVRFKAQKYNLSIWGRNITNKEYNTFYFESISKQFVQQGKPITIGATLNITL